MSFKQNSSNIALKDLSLNKEILPFPLGPYSGRTPELKSKLSGVMTNPNCEYGANFIGIHTLAQWSKCTVDGTLPSFGSDAVSCKFQIVLVIFVLNLAKYDDNLYF